MNVVGSATTEELTSPHLSELADVIRTAHSQRLNADSLVAEWSTEETTSRNLVEDLRNDLLALKQRSEKLGSAWFVFFRKRKIRRTDEKYQHTAATAKQAMARLVAARDGLSKAEDYREQVWVDVSFPLHGPAQAAWVTVASAFASLSRSDRIWDVTAQRAKSAGAERSSATMVIDRKPTTLSLASLPFFAPDFRALRWHNANGDDLYVYPGLLLVARDASTFAVIDMKTVRVSFSVTKFAETEDVPNDSRRHGTTWRYANKDGSQDARYRDNQEIPVMLYGEFEFRSPTGLNEQFMISSAETAAAFSDALSEFERLLAAS